MRILQYVHLLLVFHKTVNQQNKRGRLNFCILKFLSGFAQRMKTKVLERNEQNQPFQLTHV